jgi:hypothetical protein
MIRRAEVCSIGLLSYIQSQIHSETTYLHEATLQRHQLMPMLGAGVSELLGGNEDLCFTINR